MTPTDYDSLLNQAKALIHGVPHLISNLANISALLYHSIDTLNWVGFYLCENETLVLGPFQGKPACIEIPFGKGVCGAAVQQDAVQLIPDVHLFPGHIACDCASNSEIVIPIHHAGKVIGVLDIDSPLFSRFTEEDKIGLERIVHLIEEAL